MAKVIIIGWEASSIRSQAASMADSGSLDIVSSVSDGRKVGQPAPRYTIRMIVATASNATLIQLDVSNDLSSTMPAIRARPMAR